MDTPIGTKPRINDDIPPNLWYAIVNHIQVKLADGSFGNSFPYLCEDYPNDYVVVGSNEGLYSNTLKAEIPELDWNSIEEITTNELILDFIEFNHKYIAKLTERTPHKYFKHNHLEFDIEEGQKEYREYINLLFARNGLSYSLNENGRITRINSPILEEDLKKMNIQTGDQILDELIQDAIEKYLNPDLKYRKEALEKIWDAWERLKTIEKGKDKKAKVKVLLDSVTTDADYRTLIEDEAKCITDIGNKYMIRHTETDKIPITSSEQVDYFFNRIFPFIQMILKSTDRA